jgi:hypothetical protein
VAIKVSGRLIPIKNPPLKPWKPLINANIGELCEKGLAYSVIPIFRSDIKIFQVDAMFTPPCGKILEP